MKIVAIGGGGFYFYEAFGKDPNTCQVTNLTQRQKTIARMKEVLKKSAWPAMIVGVARPGRNAYSGADSRRSEATP